MPYLRQRKPRADTRGAGIQDGERVRQAYQNQEDYAQGMVRDVLREYSAQGGGKGKAIWPQREKRPTRKPFQRAGQAAAVQDICTAKRSVQDSGQAVYAHQYAGIAAAGVHTGVLHQVFQRDCRRPIGLRQPETFLP